MKNDSQKILKEHPNTAQLNSPNLTGKGNFFLLKNITCIYVHMCDISEFVCCVCVCVHPSVCTDVLACICESRGQRPFTFHSIF